MTSFSVYPPTVLLKAFDVNHIECFQKELIHTVETERHRLHRRLHSCIVLK